MANQTVVTRDGSIVAMGPVEITDVPANALRVAGSGMYLMPGLAEMHGHIPDPEEPQQLTEDVLFLYVANGITTVRGMQGAEGQLDLRRRVNTGELVGPNLYLAGSSFNGDDVLTPEAAIEKVHVQKAEGWHLLKVQSGLSLATYDGMVETAHAESMRFGGHVPADVGLIHAIEAGQETFDHMDGYVEYVADGAGNLDEARLAEVCHPNAGGQRMDRPHDGGSGGPAGGALRGNRSRLSRGAVHAARDGRAVDSRAWNRISRTPTSIRLQYVS